MGEGSRSGGLRVGGTGDSVPDEVRSQLTPKARTGIAPASGREESVPGGRREPGGATERMGSVTWVHCGRTQAGRWTETKAFIR